MIIPASVTHLIFDLGKVVVDIDFEKTVEAFRKISEKPLNPFFSFENQDPLITQLEIGAISFDFFCDKVREELNPRATNKEIRNALNAMMIGIYNHTLSVLESSKRHYRTIALSNTNAVHIAWLDAFVKENHGINGFHQLFDAVYYSHEMGCRKPEAEAFQYVLDKEAVKPHQCLFLDDRPENCNKSEEIGFNTCWIEKPTQVEETLDFIKSLD